MEMTEEGEPVGGKMTSACVDAFIDHVGGKLICCHDVDEKNAAQYYRDMRYKAAKHGVNHKIFHDEDEKHMHEFHNGYGQQRKQARYQ